MLYYLLHQFNVHVYNEDTSHAITDCFDLPLNTIM